MAELHVVGEIVGAMGFEDRNLFCKVRHLTGVARAERDRACPPTPLRASRPARTFQIRADVLLLPIPSSSRAPLRP
jgi:hypothetical protein